MPGTSETSNAKPLYLPGLNGIRAIASITVLVAHINDHLLQQHTYSLPVLNCGRLAVSMFFALSGFLITYLLILEREKTSTVSIPKFYIRRILRIWPLYFVYIGATLLYAFVSGTEVNLFALLLLFLFAANVNDVMGLSTPYTAHYWSLGVEEQFYLFWPWLIRFGRHIGRTVLIFLVGFSLLRIAFRFGYGGFSTQYVFVFMTRFDCMAIGGLAAWWAYRGVPDGIKMILYHPATQLASWTGLALVVGDFLPTPMLLQHQIVAFLTAVLMLNLTQNPKTLLSLEGKLWVFLGDISFGLYVWHPLLIALIGHVIFASALSAEMKVVLFLLAAPAASMLAAQASLRFLERPFLRLKDRFALVATKRRS